MQPFDYVIPKDFAEASALLAVGDGTVRPYQGGTDFLIRARGGFIKPARVVDLKGLPGMREIRAGEAGWLIIGAACTMNQVAAHPAVQTGYDLLAQACNAVASYQLRNRATVGGNCCNASPAADTAPALFCLDAVAEIYTPDGLRRVPIAQFFTGPGRTVMRPGEFLTAIHLPPAPQGAKAAFNKLGRTKIGDISTVSVAVYAWTNDEGPRTKDPLDPSSLVVHRHWAIGLGAVGPTPLRALEAEGALGADASPEGVRRAAELAAAAARPIDDIRASAAYRRAMVAVLTRRGIEAILAASSSSVFRPSSGGGAPSSVGGAPSAGSGGTA